MDFITIDFETANYSPNSACAIGLVKFINGEPADTYYSVIRPPKLYIRPDFTDIHGLTVNDVRDAPRFNELWDSAIKPFIGDKLPLAAHNASFDMDKLSSVLKHYNLPVPGYKYFCTLNIARCTWPNLKSHALASLAKEFGITYNAHHALDDALTCGKIVLMSAEKHGSKNIKELMSVLKQKMLIME